MVRTYIAGLLFLLAAACGGANKASNSAASSASNSAESSRPAPASAADEKIADDNMADASGNMSAGPEDMPDRISGNLSANIAEGPDAQTMNGMSEGNVSMNAAGTSLNETTSNSSSGDAAGESAVVESRVARYCRSAGLDQRTCNSLNDQYRDLEQGVGALAAEQPNMRVGDTYTVSLAIAPSSQQGVSASEATNQVVAIAAAQAGPRSTTASGSVQLSRRMRVTLSGSAFEIEPQGAAERDLSISGQGVWIWRVKPMREGAQNLVATVVPLATLAGPAPVELSPAQRRLDVRVSVSAQGRMGAVEAFFKSATGVFLSLAALVGAISLVVWRVRKLGQKPE